MMQRSIYLVSLPVVFGLLVLFGPGIMGFGQQIGQQGVGKVIEKKDGVPVAPEPPEHPVYDPPADPPCEDLNICGAGIESALFVHKAGMASYPRHESMLHAAIRIPLTFDTRQAATASYRTTPELGMGTMMDPDGRSRVALQFHVKTVDQDAFSPSVLTFHDEYEAEYIYNADESLRQLLTDDTITDITELDSGEEGFVIRSYRRADQLGAKVNGVYIVNGQPHLESKVYNPTPLVYGGGIKVRATERFTSGPDVVRVYSWNIDPVSKSTTFEEQHPDDSTPPVFQPWRKTVITRTALAGDDYEQIRETYEAESPTAPPGAGLSLVLALTSRDYERYTFIDGEKRIVQLKTAVTPSGADTFETLTTDFTYYLPSNNGYNTGRPSTVVRSDGMWWKFQYSHQYNQGQGSRTFRVYTPFGNTPIGSYTQGKLTSIIVNDDVYTRTERIGTQEVSRVVRTSELVGGKLIVKSERGHNTPGGPLVSYADKATTCL